LRLQNLFGLAIGVGRCEEFFYNFLTSYQPLSRPNGL
jgi:hypothetical protein